MTPLELKNMKKKAVEQHDTVAQIRGRLEHVMELTETALRYAFNQFSTIEEKLVETYALEINALEEKLIDEDQEIKNLIERL